MERIHSGKEGEDFYIILGCDELSTLEQIQAEYKVKALQLHPDKTPSSDSQAFTQLQRAKTVLTDPQLRNNYDQWRHSGISIPFEEWMARKDKICLHWMGTEKKKAMIKDGNEQGNKSSPQISFTSWNQPRTRSSVIEAFRKYQI